MLPGRGGSSTTGHVDELRIHSHAAASPRLLLPAHTTDEEVSHTELASNLSRRLGAPPVLARARARDDTKLPERCQLAANLVADPIREVRIGRIAEILERK